MVLTWADAQDTMRMGANTKTQISIDISRHVLPPVLRTRCILIPRDGRGWGAEGFTLLLCDSSYFWGDTSVWQ